MKSPLFVILTAFIYLESLAQDSIRVTRQYNDDKPESSIDSFYHNIQNTIFISLDEGFDDSLYITVNGRVVLNQYLKSNNSIGYAGSFGISFAKTSDVKILRLKFVKANFCIEEKLDLAYKSLQVRGLKTWLLIYTNQFPMRE